MRNRDGLQTTQKTIVLSVAADPEPDDLIVFQKTESSVATAPRTAALHKTSQLIGIEFSRSSGSAIGSRLCGEFRERVPGGVEPPGPLLVVAELVEQPCGDTILFLRG